MTDTNETRSSAGRVWLTLLFRHVEAYQKNDRAKGETIREIMKGLESEFPEEIKAEKALWER